MLPIGPFGGSDEQLVAAVRAGDDRAFEALYGRYVRRIAAYVRGMVQDRARAEDVTQDIFLAALRRMRDTERPIAFKPWIYEIARNACIDAHRRRSRAEEVPFAADDELRGGGRTGLAARTPTPEVAFEEKNSLARLQGAMGGLTEAHSQILVMRELEGRSYQEISERLGLSLPAVESTLFRARRRLSEEYEELVSGERCRLVTAIIAAMRDDLPLGTRDRERMARHISYCQPCRARAIGAGLDVVAMSRRSVRSRIAAWVPLPVVVRLRRRGTATGGSSEAAASAGPVAAPEPPPLTSVPLPLPPPAAPCRDPTTPAPTPVLAPATAIAATAAPAFSQPPAAGSAYGATAAA